MVVVAHWQVCLWLTKFSAVLIECLVALVEEVEFWVVEGWVVLKVGRPVLLSQKVKHLGSSLGRELTVEDKDPSPVAGEWRHRMVQKPLPQLILLVDIDRAFYMASVELIGVSAIDDVTFTNLVTEL